MGLRHGKIKWSDLGCWINGSGNLSPGYLKDALDDAETAWQRTSDPSLSKKSVNSWLGLFATDDHVSHVEKVYRSEDLLPTYAGITRQHVYECGLTSVGFRVEQVIARTHRFFHQWVVDQEHLLMARLLHTLQQDGVPPRAVRELRVDSILLQAGAKKHEGIKAHCLKATWKDLGGECTETVARAEIIQKDSKTLLDFTPALPTSSGEEPPPVPWWTDLNEEQVREAVRRGEGLNVCAVAGTGKSTLVKDIVRELRESERVEIMARCHVSSKAFSGGMTADKFILSKLGWSRRPVKSLTTSGVSCSGCVCSGSASSSWGTLPISSRRTRIHSEGESWS